MGLRGFFSPHGKKKIKTSKYSLKVGVNVARLFSGITDQLNERKGSNMIHSPTCQHCAPSPDLPGREECAGTR